MKYLFIISMLAIGCKVETVAPPQYPQNQPPPAAQAPSPTFGQCSESAWEKSKQLAGEAYDYAMTQYQEYKKNHPDKDDKPTTSEP